MYYVPLLMATYCYQEHPPLYLFQYGKGTNMHKEGLDPSLNFLTNLVLWLVRPCIAQIQIKNSSHDWTS